MTSSTPAAAARFAFDDAEDLSDSQLPAMRTTRNRYKQEIQARTRRQNSVNTDHNNRPTTHAAKTPDAAEPLPHPESKSKDVDAGAQEDASCTKRVSSEDVRGRTGEDGDDEDSSSDDDSSDDDSSEDDAHHDVKSSPLFSDTHTHTSSLSSSQTRAATSKTTSPFATTPRITGHDMSSDASSASDSSGQSDSDDSLDDLPRTDASRTAAPGAISVEVGGGGRATGSVLNSPSDIVRDVALLSTNSVKSNESSSSCSSGPKTSPAPASEQPAATRNSDVTSPPAAALSPAPRGTPQSEERNEPKQTSSPLNSNDLTALLSHEYDDLRKKRQSASPPRTDDRLLSDATLDDCDARSDRARHSSASQFSPKRSHVPRTDAMQSCAVQQTHDPPAYGSHERRTQSPPLQQPQSLGHHRNSVDSQRPRTSSSYSDCAQLPPNQQQQQQLGGYTASNMGSIHSQQMTSPAQNSHFAMSMPSPLATSQPTANFNLPNPSPSNFNTGMPQPSPGASYAMPQSSPYNITNPSPGGGGVQTQQAAAQGMPTPSPTNSNMTAPSPGNGGNGNVAGGSYGYTSGQSGGYMHDGSHMQLMKSANPNAPAASGSSAKSARAQQQRSQESASTSGYSSQRSSQRAPHHLANLNRLVHGPEFSAPPTDLGLGHPPPLVHSPASLMQLPQLPIASRSREATHAEVTSHNQRMAQYGLNSTSSSGNTSSSKHHRQRSSAAHAQNQQQPHLQKAPAPNVTVSPSMSLHPHHASFQNQAATSQLLRNFYPYHHLSQQYGGYSPFMNHAMSHVPMPPQMLPATATPAQMQQGGASANAPPSMYSPYAYPFGQHFNVNSSRR